TYEQRAALAPHPLARRLCRLMARKQTNLCIAADVTTAAELVQIADVLGPLICVLKTHIDIVDDFTDALAAQLVALSDKHDFLIFEDRKFADIGNTVRLQYTNGVYRIADWAHIVNCHALPGDGILSGLQAGVPPAHVDDRACLMIAQLSSQGALTHVPGYREAAVAMAQRFPAFVIGYIAQTSPNTDACALTADAGTETGTGAGTGAGAPPPPLAMVMTPGVKLAAGGDGLGQQYRTPADAVVRDGGDIIIVGRGIYAGAPETWAEQAERYRAAGWTAYEQRC
ncbi:hypothetical protein CXG81DRAFT_6649, partial [Caulochytrium protostelioides]